MHVTFDSRTKLGSVSCHQLPVFLRGTSEAIPISHLQGLHFMPDKKIRTLAVDPNISIQVL